MTWSPTKFNWFICIHVCHEMFHDGRTCTSTKHGFFKRLFRHKKRVRKVPIDTCSNFSPWLLRWPKVHCSGHVLRAMSLLTQTKLYVIIIRKINSTKLVATQMTKWLQWWPIRTWNLTHKKLCRSRVFERAGFCNTYNIIFHTWNKTSLIILLHTRSETNRSSFA